MSRKRGKKRHKPAAAAVTEEVLAEGSGPIPAAEVVTTTEDVITTEDVVTADDVVAQVTAGDLADVAEALLTEEAAPESEPPAPDESVEADEVVVAESLVDPVEGGELSAASTEGDLDPDDADIAGATLPTSAATMDAGQLKILVEALIFASDKPLTLQRLRQLTRVSDVKRLEAALNELTEDYRERGLILQQVSGGYQFRTRTQFSAWVQQLIAGRPVRLSRAQLETLAIIAYRQPITRPEIDDIRGVDSSATLKLLLDRTLIRVLGKREEVGRPMLYGTTKEFLDFFSLGDLRELPTLREYSELTAESRQVMSDRLGIGLDDKGGGGDDGDGGDEGGGGGGGEGGGGGGGGPEPVDPGDAPEPTVSDALADYLSAADAVDRSDAAAVSDFDAAELPTDDEAAASDEASTADAMSADEVASSDEVGAASSDEPTAATADATTTDELGASSDEAATADATTTDELGASSYEAALDELTASSDEAATDERAASSDEAAPDELAASSDEPSTDELAASSDEAAPDELAASSDCASAAERAASTAERAASSEDASTAERAASSDEASTAELAISSDEVAASSDEASIADATSTGQVNASSDGLAAASAESALMGEGSTASMGVASSDAFAASNPEPSTDGFAASIDEPSASPAELSPSADGVDSAPLTAAPADGVAPDAPPPEGESDPLDAMVRRVMARAPQGVVAEEPTWPAGSQRFVQADVDEGAPEVPVVGAVVLDEQHAAGAAREPAEPTHE